MFGDPGQENQGVINILSVGTKMLVKDVMDNFLRSFVDCKTQYASNMAAALRSFSEKTIHILFSETKLEDGSAYRLVQTLGGVQTGVEDLYIILAIEENTPEYMALASEVGAHSVLVKPFALNDIQKQIEKYNAWKVMPKPPWILLLGEADMAIRDRRYRDAEINYKDAIECAPNNPEPLYRAAMYYYGKQEYSIAEPMLKKTLELNANYVKGIHALGLISLAKRDIEKAKQYFDQAQKISPHNPDRLAEYPKLYLEMALDALRNAIRLDPSNPSSRTMFAKILALKKDYVNAVKELEANMPNLRDEKRLEAQTYIALCKKLGGFAK